MGFCAAANAGGDYFDGGHVPVPSRKKHHFQLFRAERSNQSVRDPFMVGPGACRCIRRP
jgi:hypothetical protein